MPHLQKLKQKNDHYHSFFSKMPSISNLVFNKLFPKVNQIIGNGETSIKFKCDLTNGSKDNLPTSFLGGHLFRMSPVSHLVFNKFFPEVNQIIRKPQRTTTLNLNALQSTVYKISCQQAFWAAFIFKMSPISHLVFNGFFPKGNQRGSDHKKYPENHPVKFNDLSDSSQDIETTSFLCSHLGKCLFNG